MRLIISENGTMMSELTIAKEAIFVGSQPGCRIHLPDSRIAEQQLVIYPGSNGEWTLEQLHSENPVHVNGMTVLDKTQLKTGDEITLCDYLIRAYPAHEDHHPQGPAEVSMSVAQLERFASFRLPHGAVVKKTEEPLTVQQAQLHRIGQVNLQLSQCTQPEQVMNIALKTVLEVFTAHRAWIGLRRVNYGSMEYTEGRLITGKTADLTDIGSKLQPRVLDRAQFVLLPRVSTEDLTSVLAGPLTGPDGTLGMLYLDTGGEGGRRFDAAELDYFVVMCNLLAVQLDAVFKQIAKNREATINGEVSVAHEIQARVTPRKLPQWETLQFGAFREPGRQHSGDVYDLVRLSNNTAAFIVAHTQAAGAVPSMLIAQVQAAFRSSAMHLDAPHIFMRCMNWLLYDGQKDHPLDCFIGTVDPATGELRYSTAGKMGAYIIGQRGDERCLMLPNATASLGLDKSAAYPTTTAQLEPDETLVVFTPGVTTATNRENETFGEGRFVNILCDGFGQLASSMLKEMLSDLRNFTEGGSQPNDVTVLMAHRV